MVEYETSITAKDDEGNITCADVNFFDDAGNVVHRVTITTSEQIEELRNKIENLDKAYFTEEELKTVLKNISEDTTINATKLNDLTSADFALKEHTHNEYANKNHASANAGYGLGDASNYGHVKTRNDLSSTSFKSGEALAAYQGKVLSDRLESIEDSTDELIEDYYKNSLRVTIYRTDDPKNISETRPDIDCTRGYHKVYAKISCDDPTFTLENRSVIMVLNGVPYVKTTDSQGVSEKLNITSNFPTGTYVMQVFVRGSSKVRSCSDMKILKVT